MELDSNGVERVALQSEGEGLGRPLPQRWKQWKPCRQHVQNAAKLSRRDLPKLTKNDTERVPKIFGE